MQTQSEVLTVQPFCSAASVLVELECRLEVQAAIDLFYNQKLSMEPDLPLSALNTGFIALR